MRTRFITPDSLDEGALEALVRRTLRGDQEAWQALWLALALLLEIVAGNPRAAGRLSKCPEARCDVVIRVMAALQEDGFRRLAELGERLACRDGSFRPWLTKLAHDAAVDGVRAHPDFVQGKKGRWAGRALLRETMPEDLPPESRQAEAHRILERCPEVLEPAQLDAFLQWLQGGDAAEIAAALHLAGGAEKAARLVRSAVARLRWLTTPRPGNARSKKSTRVV